MLKQSVVIGSEEFKNAVLDVIRKANLVINDIENPRYERLADGWIKDKEMGLDWGPSSSEAMNLSKAQEYCNSVGGRLPTVDELQTILDRSMYNPPCDKRIFKDVKSDWYWTSDKCAWSTTASWCVSFYYGCVTYNFEYSGIYVRPVRASQC